MTSPGLIASTWSWNQLSSLLFLVLFCLIHSGSSLKCYHCIERPRSAEKHLSCAYFDTSSKFHKECDKSTFCMKRTSLFRLHNGTFVTIYVHKCADQSHRTMVQDKNGDWNWANLLKADLYNEGCFQHHHSPSVLTTETSHCFCSSDLCNSSSLPAPSSTMMTMSVIVIAVTLLSLFS